MRKLTKRATTESGSSIRVPANMRKLLNYNILNLLNRTHRCGSLDMPELHCNTNIYPDFLALYNERSLYNHSKMTAVCFYSYDIDFDGKNGLYWAIYFNDRPRLNYFKERFKNVKLFISPDYSVFNDIHMQENMYRIWRSRIVALWFILELHAVVIPNISYVNESSFETYFCGLEKCSVVAFSTKDHIRNHRERQLLIAAVKYAVDNLPLKAIVVYSACGKDETSLDLFKYAIVNNIKIIIPDNTLRTRNMNRSIK